MVLTPLQCCEIAEHSLAIIRRAKGPGTIWVPAQHQLIVKYDQATGQGMWFMVGLN